MRTVVWFVLAIVGAVMMPRTSQAAEGPWQFRFTPYLWVPKLYTDIRIRSNPPAETDSSTNLLDVLDFAVLASGEIRKGNWGVVTEFNYLALSNDATYAGGLFGAEVDVDGVMGGAALNYRFLKNDRFTTDIFGGFRIWSLDAGIDFTRLPAVSQTKTWVDPIFGFRGSYKLTKDFFIDGLGDVGGFGVGSDLQWELVGRAGYRFNDTVSVALGYRHLVLNFDDNKLDLDATMTGPFLAIDFNW